MVKKQEQENLKGKGGQEQLLSPKYDIVFHSLFRKGNEKITKALIQDITQREYKIIDMDKNVILSDGNVEHKNEILDLKVELDDGEICNIEVQLANKKNFKERMLEYWAKLYAGQLHKGEDYPELRRTIIIAIVDFNIKEFEKEGYHTKWKIREDKNHKLILTNNFEIHIIEIKKAKESLKNNQDDKIAQWMSFFDNPNSMEVKSMSEKNEDINEALEQLRRLSSNKMLREKLWRQEMYERDRRAEILFAKDEALEEGREEGLKQGLEQGLEQGKNEKSIEIAKNMLEKNMAIEVISEITGLTEKEIEQLKKEI